MARPHTAKRFRGRILAPRRTLTALVATTLAVGGLTLAVPGVAGAAGTMTTTASGPSTVVAGNPWVLTGSATNTGATTISNVTSIGSTSRGHILSTNQPAFCNFTNYGDNVTGYSVLACNTGTFPWTPGFTGAVTVQVDTTGLEGQSITYSGHVNSPDLTGGRTADATATVQVLDPAPSVAITSPLNGSLLDNVTDTTLSADASAVAGSAITQVDFTLDGEFSLGSAYGAPYQVTIPANSLSLGSHTLTATAWDDAGRSASDTITVIQGNPPTIAIDSPADGTTLDTGSATAFRATAAPSTSGTVTSVDFLVDGNRIASLRTPVPSTNDYLTSIPPNSLSAGSHTLQVQVNDSNGQSASTSVTVTQPTLVGPTVTIAPIPLKFDPTYFDSPHTFGPKITLQSGDAVQSVVWDVDGTTLLSAPKPTNVTIDPVTLGPGTHALNLTVTTNRGVGSDTLAVTVPPATITVDDTTPGDLTITPSGPRFVPGPGSTADAVWVVPVATAPDSPTNHTGTARSVTLDATVNDGVNAQGFDLTTMPGCNPATVFEGVAGVRCVLGDLAPGTTVYVPVRVPTDGLADGTQLSGRVAVQSTNASVPGTSALAPTTAVVPTPVLDQNGQQIGAAEVIQVSAPTSKVTSTVVNTTAPVSPTNQFKITVSPPRRVTLGSLTQTVTTAAVAAVRTAALSTLATTTTSPTKLVAPPPVVISLAAGDVNNPAVCPADNPCRGIPSAIIGDFGKYKDKAHPIKVTVSTYLPGATLATVGDTYFVGDDGTYQLTGATGRGPCVKNPTTKQFVTPCELGKPKFVIVKDPVTLQPIGVTATDTVLFVGGDPYIRH